MFGSFARNENRNNSDIDLLILVDKKHITYSDEKRYTSPLYDLEFETGQIISPIVLSKTKWEKIHQITPLYEDIKREGIEL